VTARIRHVAALAAFVTITLAGPACTATNYLDPDGPRYYDTARAAAREEPAGEASRPLRVVTFNIEYGREIDRAVSLLRSNEALRNADILFLQEMDSRGVVRIATELGLNYLYFPGGIHPQAKQDFGTAILSPWPIEGPAKIVLPHGSAVTGLRRVVTAATVRWGRVPVRVFSVHLPAPMAISLEQRREQVQVIVDAARKTTDVVVVAGDFNGRSVGPWFEQAGYAWITSNMPGTSRGPGFWLSFDHVFAKGLESAGDTPRAGYVDATGISDHRAVWVTLDLRTGGIRPGTNGRRQH
jgi:endonuclease/exonuclease/phosphatase family metal-dependent hydrolase